MYTQEQEQIRMGLHQFFGSILVNSNLEDSSMRKQSLIALVLEELVKICKKDDNEIDIVAAKPILRATHYILEGRMNNIKSFMSKEGFEDCDIEDATEDLNWIVADLNKYLDSITEGK